MKNKLIQEIIVTKRDDGEIIKFAINYVPEILDNTKLDRLLDRWSIRLHARQMMFMDIALFNLKIIDKYYSIPITVKKT